MRSLRASILVAVVVGAIGAQSSTALAHGGNENEMEVADLSMQPARILAQQALAELRVRNDSEEAAVRLDAALESQDNGEVDMSVLRKATATLDGGDPQGAIPLLDEALSRPLGAASGKALHESGREFQPGTGTQEIVGIAAGAILLALGAALLAGARLRAQT